MALLHEAGIAAAACPDLDALTNELGSNITFIVLSEEAMRNMDVGRLRAWIDAQPTWSDLPVIILTQKGGGPESNPAAARLADALGNVSFLERPFHPTTFASMARTSSKARLRQFEARDRLDELHESEERLATAMLAGKLGSWSIDIETEALVTSPLCRSIYGLAEADNFTYPQLLAMIHPDDLDAMQAAVRRSIKSGDDYNVEYRTVWPDGSIHWVQVNGRTLQDASGRTRALVGVAMDTTDRKQFEVALRRSNEWLERRVAERTTELESTHAKVLDEIRQREQVEDQLRQAQKMEVIGQLTGGVAHDFNNLLMAVLSNLDLLRKHVPDDPRSSRLIDGALQGAKRGAALTQRLLAFARRQSLTVEPANIGSLIEGMRSLLERSLGTDIQLSFSLAPKLPMAMVDANQLELALLNLVVNARDAMPDGGSVTISVDAVKLGQQEDLAPGQYVRLSVVDTGIGMDADTLQRAIEPFFSTKELGKGTGLGLSMIHGLAVQLNGALRLSSEPGKGTRAELFLPATSAPVEDARPVEDAADIEPAGHARILLVDDDVLIAMSTVDMLEDLGHHVIEANSGASALEALQSNGGVDLMITDFAMPGMNGAQLAEAARKLKPGLPILLATGYAELPKGESIDLPRLGKPYSQRELAREIDRLLGGARGYTTN
ncbi:MAG: ATP-binding protein [Hyphomonadaceae bacterium]